MQVELTIEEIDLLDRALLAWEQEPDKGQLGRIMLATLTCGRDAPPEEVKRALEREEEPFEHQKAARRRKASFLRAKLFGAQLIH